MTKTLAFRRVEGGVKRRYAVKQVVMEDGDDWKLREVENHCRLQHPNVAALYGFWTRPVSVLSSIVCDNSILTRGDFLSNWNTVRETL